MPEFIKRAEVPARKATKRGVSKRSVVVGEQQQIAVLVEGAGAS